METFLHDLKFAFRMLVRYPGYAAIVITTLALGIGGNSAVFSVINGVLLRPLPYEEANRIVMLYGNNQKLNWPRGPVSVPNYIDYRDQSQSFENLAAFTGENFNITDGDKPEVVQGAYVSPAFFSVLRVKFNLGRAFLPEEENSGSSRVIVISSGLLKRRYGDSPTLIGKTIRVNGESFTVVGITPASFQPFNRGDDLWVPLVLDGNDALRRPSGTTAKDFSARRRRFLFAIARLKQGMTSEQAQTEMRSIASRLEEQYPEANNGWSLTVVPLYEQLVGRIRPALLVLLGAVGLVLLISCVNVANLLIARATTRTKEVALRMAIGASRTRLIRQMLTESMLMALIGGGLGLLLAYWGVKLLVAVSAENIPRITEIGLDSNVLLFTLFVSLLAAIIFGIAPALHASRVDLAGTLKAGGRGSSGVMSERARGLLVVSEMVLATIVLIGAGLMVKSLYYLQKVSLGFNPESVLTLRVSVPMKYSEGWQKTAFYQQALQRIENLPGVQSVAAIHLLPLSGGRFVFRFTIDGRPPASADELLTANYRSISPNYFRTMAVPMLSGRDFSEHDNSRAPGVIIINEAMAQHYWPDENPIGKHITIGFGEPVSREVVSVVGNVRHATLDTDSGDEMYVPYLQSPWPAMNIVVRTASGEASLIEPMTQEILKVDREQPVSNAGPMRQIVSDSISQERLSVLLLVVFAGLALLLAIVGIYGLIAYSVTQRTHEIGIRMALGAQTRDILTLILSQGMKLTLLGVAIGSLSALLLTRVLSGLLFGVRATDPLTFISIALLLISVALIASYIPARRATTVSPMEALRHD